MSAAFDKLLAPNNVSDWLDRRAGLDAEARKARIRADVRAEVRAWLEQHHPRFRGAA